MHITCLFGGIPIGSEGLTLIYNFCLWPTKLNLLQEPSLRFKLYGHPAFEFRATASLELKSWSHQSGSANIFKTHRNTSTYINYYYQWFLYFIWLFFGCFLFLLIFTSHFLLLFANIMYIFIVNDMKQLV